MNNLIFKKCLIFTIILMFFASAFSGISEKTTTTSTIPTLLKITSQASENSSHTPSYWQQINEDGFGDKHNVGTRAVTVFNGYLCVGVTNFNVSTGKMNGCELWCYNGVGWIQSVGNHASASIDAGFGNKNNAECAILIEFHGWLYAGTANNVNGCELWRTKNPLTGPWEKIVEKGFGYKSNLGMWCAEIFKGSLYIGTINFPKGCEVWRTNDGENFEAVVGGHSRTRSGFGHMMNFYAWSMKEYDGKLYVGTQNTLGGQIWRSSDGFTWECIVGPKGDVPGGFQLFDLNYGIRTLNIFNNELYAGTAALPSMTVSLKITGKDSNPREIEFFKSPEIGFQIWRLNTTKDPKWECIVGGVKAWNRSGKGFGDNHNIYAWTMKIFNNSLYVGTFNVKKDNISFSLRDVLNYILKENIVYLIGSDLVSKEGDGCQIWKTNNGIDWIQEVGNDTSGPGNGFGDTHNNGIRSMAVYRFHGTDSLIVGTINAVTGCELWQYQ